jgi:excinuclease UvrABC helicase subunit UvrB
MKPSTATLPRVIVRCKNDSEIQEIAARLRERGHSAIEIHDTFSDSEDEDRYRTVPQPSNKDATFWVHQNKLIEGLDDPSFCLLAIYGGFRNTRALVRQIGRIVRNPNRSANQFAHVFSRAGDRQAERWTPRMRRSRMRRKRGFALQGFEEGQQLIV